jgi:hypothetical protein
MRLKNINLRTRSNRFPNQAFNRLFFQRKEIVDLGFSKSHRRMAWMHGVLAFQLVQPWRVLYSMNQIWPEPISVEWMPIECFVVRRAHLHIDPVWESDHGRFLLSGSVNNH